MVQITLAIHINSTFIISSLRLQDVWMTEYWIFFSNFRVLCKSMHDVNALYKSSLRQPRQPCYKLALNTSLTHWGRETHICVGKLTSIASDNGSSPSRRQAIIWINAGILLIRPLGTNFSEILIEIHTFSFKKMHLKMSSAKRWPFCLGLNEFSIHANIQLNIYHIINPMQYAHGFVMFLCYNHLGVLHYTWSNELCVKP